MSTKVFKQGIALTAVSADPSSPKDGELQLSDGTSRAAGYYRYDSGTSSWLPLGGGGGSLDILHQEDFETTTASDFSTGNNAAPDAAGTGTLDGTLADEASTPIGSISSLKYTMGSTSADDFFLNGEDIALDEKHTNNWLGISFYFTYNGDDDDIRFVVLDQDDAELTTSIEYIKSNSTATRFSTAVYIPDATTGLRYGFQVVTGNNTKILVIDDLELSTNPFVYKNLVETTSISLSDNDGRGISANTESVPFNGSGTGWTSGADGSNFTNGNYYEVQNNNSVIQIDGSVYLSSASTVTINLYVNGSLYKAVGSVNANNPVHLFKYTSSKGEFSKDDKLSFGFNGSYTLFTSTTSHYLNLVESSTTEHVVTPATSTATDLIDYTPTFTGFGTVSNVNVKYAQVIDHYRITGSFTVGTPTAVEAQMTLPNSKVVKSGITVRNVGTYYRGGVVTSKGGPVLATDGDAFLNFGSSSTFSGTGVDPITPLTSTSSNFSVGETVTFDILVPIEGLTSNATFLAAIPTQQVAYVKDVKANNTQGGTFTSGSWQTRDLNTLSGDTGFISLSSNQFTLPAGKYIIKATAPAYGVQQHTAKLYNITDSSDQIIGLSTWVTGAGDQGESLVEDMVEISSSKTFEVQHRCTLTNATDGLGVASNYGVDEIYTQVKITKLK